MSKNTTGIFLVILFACLSFSLLLAQTEEEYLQNVKDYMESISDQKIPHDFFLGEWGGTIHGEIVGCPNCANFDPGPCPNHQPNSHHPFEVEFIGYPAKHGLGPTSGGAKALMKMTATWPNKFTICDTVVCMIDPSHDVFYFVYPVTTGTYTEVAYNAIFQLAAFDIEVKDNEDNEVRDNNVINISSGGIDPDLWEKSWAKGELHSIYIKKYILGENIFEDEPIKTDKFTQKDIEIPEVGEVKLKPGSECKFNNKNSIEHSKGKIHIKVKNLENDDIVKEEKKDMELKPELKSKDKKEMDQWDRKLYSKVKNLENDDIVNKEKKDAKVEPGSKSKDKKEMDQWEGKLHSNVENLSDGYFGITTPVAIAGVRGTDFITIVGKNSTTLKVFDGQVAFSDKKNKKTVIVKKNQMSTVKAGGVPSEPEEMDRAAKWLGLY